MTQEVFQNIEELKECIDSLNANSVFLVRGKSSFELCGGDKFIKKILPNKQIVSFSDFETNPQLNDLIKGVELFKKLNSNIIIALGGGSVLDMAKLISVYAHQENNFTDITTGKAKLQTNKTPLIAIPTTAGTGAEATHFAVLYMGKTKYSVASESILPDYVYLSSEFSKTANKYLTACSGADAFCQAIESVWSVNANNQSIKYGLEAISIIWDQLPLSVTENNAESKTKMQYASYLAGKAINITKTTAPHAISYAFTSYYGIAHGHAVALSLPYFLKFNLGVNSTNCTDKKGTDAVKERIEKILDALKINISDAEEKLEAFFNKIGISIKLNEVVGNNFNANLIIDNVNTERLNNNPRKVESIHIQDFIKGTI